MRNHRWPIAVVAALAIGAAGLVVGTAWLARAEVGPFRIIVPLVASDEPRATAVPTASPTTSSTPSPTVSVTPSPTSSPGASVTPTAGGSPSPSPTLSPTSTPPSSSLSVRNVSWYVDEAGYPQVRGEVKNGLSASVFNVEVTVTLYSVTGAVLASDSGLVDLEEIPAGGVSPFSIAVFEKIAVFHRATAEVTDFSTEP